MADDNIRSMTDHAASILRDEVLARRRRIRRAVELPQYLVAEVKRRHPVQIIVGVTGLSLRCRHGAWRRLEHGYLGEREPRIRTIHAWIMCGRRRLGSIELVELDAELVGSFALFDAMDAESGELMATAEALLSCWPDFETTIAGYGNVLILDHLWADSRRLRPRPLIQAIERLLSELIPTCSIVVGRPFPTEYGGRVPDDAALSNIGFNRRMASMIRAAERRLSLKPLPLSVEEDVFLWRPCAKIDLAPPAHHKNWRDELSEDPVAANDA